MSKQVWAIKGGHNLVSGSIGFRTPVDSMPYCMDTVCGNGGGAAVEPHP